MSISASVSPSSIHTASKSLRILYADDVAELRRVMELSLGKDGHRVTTEPDGRAALDRVIAAPGDYDVIITDHHMPVMNGLEFVTRLREQHFGGKILVFSSELGEETAEAYRKLSVDYILPKPIFPATLRGIIASL